MRIETGRMLIRPFQADDLDDLQEILGDPEVMAQAEPAYDAEKTRAFLMDFCVARQGAVAVCLKDSGKVIGYALCADRHEKDVYELGWLFNRAYWRQGLAYESMSALIAYLFTEANAHKVFAEAVDEIKSVPLMKKPGLKHEGTQKKHARDNTGAWRDLHFYGLLQEDYLSNQMIFSVSETPPNCDA